MSTVLARWIGRGPGLLPHAAFPLLALFMFLVFLALIVVGVVLLLRKGGPGAASQLPAGDDALSTIRIRYAKGEMTREEFLQANTDLGGPPPPE